MRTLTEPLQEAQEYKTLVEALAKPKAKALADGCVPSQKLHLMDALSRENALSSFARFRLIVTSSDKKVREIRDEYLFYDRNTVIFPAKDLIFYQADLRGRELEKERIRCLRRLVEGRPTTVVTTFAALMTPQVPLSAWKSNVLQLEKRQTYSLEELSRKLVRMGYEKNFQVDAPGQFAVRGDIVDVFDLTEENPYRIEFFDEEVDSIRSFDLETQRSIEPMELVKIYPATELILSDARLSDGIDRIREEEKKTEEALRSQGHMEAAHRLSEGIGELCEAALEYRDFGGLEGYIHYFYPQTDSFLEMFPEEHSMIFLDEPVHLREEGEAVELEFRESMISRSEKGYVLPGQMQLVCSAALTASRMNDYRCLGLTALAAGDSFFLPECIVSVHARSVPAYNKSFDTLVSDLKKYKLQKYRIVIISASRTRAKRLAGDLTERGLTSFYSENPDRILGDGEIMTYYGNIAHGFEYPQIRFIVIAETDIFGSARKTKKVKRHYDGESIRDFAELKVGDYVVHEDHGIGVYRGVEKIEVDGIAKDYIKIEYGGGGTLYILPGELKSLQKYASQDAAKPKLNKLGTQEWTSTRNKVKGAVEEVAQDLVELYAKRQAMKGHRFSPDTVWQREFEEMFPYEETQDQLNAIEDTKHDMESDKIMDRLICGDVGYGKTEIAIRAAFKAVQDGLQVAVLVPTTILAQQHFNTFTERMKEYPVCVEMMSRFRTAAEQKKTKEGLESGRVDIVIGTHRILSKDVKFKRLGLLVVDEEQRFGVTHKEKIKKLRENVDVLTLSATPIPRTLHMSLIGIRDMSVLEEAPQDRVSIQTYVMEYNEEMVREAILRELSRGGQVYYVYNRVNDIAEVAGRLQQQVPEARISFAHGQMNESELEKIMYDFISGGIDVLVSTTIIETGLDISNVNTIIIHDSDRMGLSQLYQLRGRVGRSNRTAYAFLMYKKDKMLKEVAEKRLAAIREFTDLGSGFRIAMRDLEIRGAGSVLGRAQHGHMTAVGYDLYCKMLDTAVKHAKGLPVPEEKNTFVNLSVDAFIPDSYIMNEAQKLDIYKKIAAVASLEDCDDIRDELRDRFGEKIPASAENLLRIALIRSIAGKLDMAEIVGGDGSIRVTMNKDAAVQVAGIPRFLAKYQGRLQFLPKGQAKGELKGQPYFTLRYAQTGVTTRDEEELLAQTEGFLVNFSEILR
ncbi:MAG: transcription-repair coupling factor [Lachnospiraceae bacterium]|nr:transcription-repair coupling factor [Bacillota bacterium]MDY2948893.1 transcription-repair coupling factor [Lachnospiraceae bacterium]